MEFQLKKPNKANVLGSQKHCLFLALLFASGDFLRYPRQADYQDKWHLNSALYSIFEGKKQKK